MNIVDIINKEVRVLEVQHERKDNSGSEPCQGYCYALLLSESFNKNTENIAYKNGHHHKDRVFNATPSVEHEAERQQNYIFKLERYGKIQYQKCRKEIKQIRYT